MPSLGLFCSLAMYILCAPTPTKADCILIKWTSDLFIDFNNKQGDSACTENTSQVVHCTGPVSSWNVSGPLSSVPTVDSLCGLAAQCDNSKLTDDSLRRTNVEKAIKEFLQRLENREQTVVQVNNCGLVGLTLPHFAVKRLHMNIKNNPKWQSLDGNVDKLEYLDLSHNDLEHFPSISERDSTVEKALTLDLSYNKIEAIYCHEVPNILPLNTYLNNNSVTSIEECEKMKKMLAQGDTTLAGKYGVPFPQSLSS